MKKNNWH